MLILGIESATSQVGCALGGPDGLLASAHTVRPRRHAESLAPQIQFVVDQAGIAMADIGAIAVDVGPGLFTGLRVGITTAMSLAYALKIRVVTSTSLRLLASAAAVDDRDIVAVVDARRGEVFHARYRPSPSGLVEVTAPAVSSPSDLATDLNTDGSEMLFVGDGARAYIEVFEALPGVDLAPPAFDRPSAAALAELAHPIAERGDMISPIDVAPLYLREPDAKPNWEPTVGVAS